MPFTKGHKLSAESIAKKQASLLLNPSFGFLGKHHSQETKDKMSRAQKRRKHWWGGLKGDANPSKRPEVREKIRQARLGSVRSDAAKRKTSETIKRRYAAGEIMLGRTGVVPWNKGKKCEYLVGERNHKWKGGVTTKNEADRKCPEYKAWRKAVFERDNYTCVWCGKVGHGDIHADHIKPFADYPELRFDVNNGRTLCVPCHKKTDTYPKGLVKSHC